MTSNFQFLEQEFKTFFDRAIKAEKLVITDPRTSLIYARMALESGINWIYANDAALELPYDTSIHSLLVQPEFKAIINHKLYSDLFTLKTLGNLATHNNAVNDIDSHHAIEYLFYFAKWFAKTYGNDTFQDPGIFNFNDIPKQEEEGLTKAQVKRLTEKLQKELDKQKALLKEQEEQQEKLAAENKLYRKQQEIYQLQIKVNRREANKQQESQVPRNEAETRKYLIDVALREAGWDLDGVNDKEFKVDHMPKSTNPSGVGYIDYVLWDNDGLPLALVEAKSTLKSVTEGENQAQLYADSLEKTYGQRPVMYYSNGYETFLWDDAFYKQSRPVHGFYTKAELQTLMFRRKNRKDIRTVAIDQDIAGRFYQMRAIKSIAEHFTGNDKSSGKMIGTNRAALLVLATGTGKTRTSIAFSKLLLECNWAKRILFLADRISLVKQAKVNFVKLLPEHSCVNLLEEKDNPDARIAFSTYNTMMTLIDGSKNDEGRFYGVGHFDLIIIDEAHRSIYKKYQAIFQYFDALFLGLTATPKNRIDHNTYHVFGLPDKSPTDAYTFEEAVESKHLVPYRSIEVPTKFLREGIKYDELSEAEKEQFEEEILDGEEATGNEWIKESELNTWLFNKPTAIKTLRYILKLGIKKRGGDELGKTIIFAKNQKHAQFLKGMFMELDKEQFGNDYVKVITHSESKAQEMIERFCDEEKDRLPQIAISVDMMDTGIDAPSCVNLVFYKPVKSYSKFWQMIGRGSRLRPNLFGEGQDKTHFIIFDLCGNFEFFKENPEGIEASAQESLTEILFKLRLQLAEYLRSKQFQDKQELVTYRKELLDDLYDDIASLDLERFDVKMQLKTVHEYGQDKREVWNQLTKKDIHTIENTLSLLVKPKHGDSDMARYYDKLLFSLVKKALETPNREEYFNAYINPISKVATTSQKLLKKTSVPAVKMQEDLIKLPLDENFWKIDGIAHLEKIRKGIRELVKHINPEDQRYVTTDFDDVIIEDKIKDSGIVNEEGESNNYSNSSPFKNNIHRLEEIIRKNRDHITISRLRNGENITTQELQQLEQMLFEDIDRESLENELGSDFNLVGFIISLVGLSEKKVNEAFSDFTNTHQLNSKQIQFLETIKQFLTKNGKINPEKLYDSPFKNYHSSGIDGVFNEKQADTIFEIVKGFNKAN